MLTKKQKYQRQKEHFINTLVGLCYKQTIHTRPEETLNTDLNPSINSH